jgi:hypothetical protein
MEKEAFKQAVRTELRRVPLQERRSWDDHKLMAWYSQAQAEESFLTWERCPSDPMQWVSGFCKDLIGSKAW